MGFLAFLSSGETQQLAIDGQAIISFMTGGSREENVLPLQPLLQRVFPLEIESVVTAAISFTAPAYYLPTIPSRWSLEQR